MERNSNTRRRATITRTRSRLAIALALLFTLANGCGGAPDPSESAGRPAHGASDGEFVEYVACLTLALQEGLRNPQATLRAQELGAPNLVRSDIEEHAARMGDDAERWVTLFDSIEERIGELRREQRAAR
jgi:hypothetical protein